MFRLSHFFPGLSYSPFLNVSTCKLITSHLFSTDKGLSFKIYGVYSKLYDVAEAESMAPARGVLSDVGWDNHPNSKGSESQGKREHLEAEMGVSGGGGAGPQPAELGV